MSGTSVEVFITVGPVSEFIGGGRRSRDLWYGSQWLSTLVGTIADEMILCSTEDKTLIFNILHPSQERLDTARMENTDGHGKRYRARLQNKILANAYFSDTNFSEEKVHAKLNQTIARLESHARLWYTTELETIKENWGDLIDSSSLARQIAAIKNGDFIEFYAGWSIDKNSNPAAARAEAIQMVTGRKNTRIFKRSDFSIDGRPKSDLDAGRDSILAEPGTTTTELSRYEDLRLKAGVRAGEQLDAVGFARRLAVYRSHHPEILPELPFPSLARIAFDPYLKNAIKKNKTILQSIKHDLTAAYKNQNISKGVMYSMVSKCRDPDRYSIDSKLFPHDAQFLMENGIDTLAKEFGILSNNVLLKYSSSQIENDAVKRLLRGLKSKVKALHKLNGGAPDPYYAMVAFDGDGVGNAFKGLDNDRYQLLAQSLDEFADKGAETLEQGILNGCAFYFGGDEGLMVLPLASLPLALQEYSELFDSVTSKYSSIAQPAQGHQFQTELSLSFGVAVTHIKHDMRDARRQALHALESAKKRRKDRIRDNKEKKLSEPTGWIETREFPRGGSVRTTSGFIATHQQIKGFSSSYPHQLNFWRRCLNNSDISMSLAQDLRELYQRKSVTTADEKYLLQLAKAMPKQKWRRSNSASLNELEHQIDELFTCEADVINFANILLLAARINQSNPDSNRRHSA